MNLRSGTSSAPAAPSSDVSVVETNPVLREEHALLLRHRDRDRGLDRLREWQLSADADRGWGESGQGRRGMFSLGMPSWLRLLVLRMKLAGQGFSDTEMRGALQKYSNFPVADVAAHLLRRRNSKRKRREDEAKIRAEIARRKGQGTGAEAVKSRLSQPEESGTQTQVPG